MADRERRVAGIMAMLDLLQTRAEAWRSWCSQSAAGITPNREGSQITEGEVETVETSIISLARQIRGDTQIDEGEWERSRPFCKKIERKMDEYWTQEVEYWRCFLIWITKSRMFLTGLAGYAGEQLAQGKNS
jgi:hypothetical protein